MTPISCGGGDGGDGGLELARAGCLQVLFGEDEGSGASAGRVGCRNGGVHRATSSGCAADDAGVGVNFEARGESGCAVTGRAFDGGNRVTESGANSSAASKCAR